MEIKQNQDAAKIKRQQYLVKIQETSAKAGVKRTKNKVNILL
jgi:hypothetical protein